MNEKLLKRVKALRFEDWEYLDDLVIKSMNMRRGERSGLGNREVDDIHFLLIDIMVSIMKAEAGRPN